MALALGPVAIAFIFLTILTLVTIYWILTQWKSFTANIPVVGSALASVAQWLMDRNMEIINQVLTVSHQVISWGITQLEDGFHLLHDLYNAAIVSQLGAFGSAVASLQFWKDTVATAMLTALNQQVTAVQSTLNGFVQLNIAAFNAWKAATEMLLVNVVLPKLMQYGTALDIVIGTTIPALKGTADALNAKLDLLITTTINAMRQDLTNLQITTAAVLNDPIKGVIPRVGAIEGELAQVIPWAATIGLTIPAAINLAKLAKNPCWCTTEGPLQDNGTLELATLMDLL